MIGLELFRTAASVLELTGTLGVVDRQWVMRHARIRTPEAASE